MENKLVRWPRIVIPAISMLFAGVIYAWSVLKAPLEAEFGWSSSALALNFTLTLCFFCIGGVLGSRITRRVPPRIGLLLAAACIAVGFLLSSRLSGQVVVLYISYAGLAGPASESPTTSSSPPPTPGSPIRRAPAPAC